MKAIAIGNTAKDLSATEIAEIGFPQTRFDVQIGKSYEIYGMLIWEASLRVLIVDETNMPFWNPAGLFSLNTLPVPKDWFFKMDSDKCIWGYKKLVEDESHYEGLINRSEDDLIFFFKMREELKSIEQSN